MILRLAEVLLEGGLERSGMGRFRHLWQRLRQPLLGVVQVFDLIEEQGFERVQVLASKQTHDSHSLRLVIWASDRLR